MRFPFPEVLLTALALISCGAHAALGGKPLSQESTQATSPAQSSTARAQLRAATVSNGYTVQESVIDAGITLREFITTQGVVFAVAWQGPNLPDLQILLGNYFPQFSSAMAARRSQGVRGPVALSQDDLVVESFGHLRDYRGRAYVRSLLPPQISLDEIQ